MVVSKSRGDVYADAVSVCMFTPTSLSQPSGAGGRGTGEINTDKDDTNYIDVGQHQEADE